MQKENQQLRKTIDELKHSNQRIIELETENEQLQKASLEGKTTVFNLNEVRAAVCTVYGIRVSFTGTTVTLRVETIAMEGHLLPHQNKARLDNKMTRGRRQLITTAIASTVTTTAGASSAETAEALTTTTSKQNSCSNNNNNNNHNNENINNSSCSNNNKNNHNDNIKQNSCISFSVLRIWSYTKTVTFSWWFLLFSSPVCLTMYWYCKEKFHVDHSWEFPSFV